MSTKNKLLLEAFETIANLTVGYPAWLPLSLAIDFVRSPSPSTLAEILTRLAEADWITLYGQSSGGVMLRLLPWPVGACIAAALRSNNLLAIAESARIGELGNEGDWASAEERWVSHGIRSEDVLYEPSRGLPFDQAISREGWPGAYSGMAPAPDREKATDINKIILTLERLPATRAPPYAFWLLCMAASISIPRCETIDPDRVKNLLEQYSSIHKQGETWWADDIVSCPEDISAAACRPWIDFFDWLGRSKFIYVGYPMRFGVNRPSERKCTWGDVWQAAFNSDTSKSGLLRVLAYHVAAGYVANSIVESKLKIEELVEPNLQVAAVVLLITRRKQSTYTAARLAQLAVDALESVQSHDSENLLFRALERHLDSLSDSIFLLELHEKTRKERHERLGQIERLLRQTLRRRASDLQKPGVVKALVLPELSASVAG